jgi:fructose-bisphosphate aldolase class I
MDIEMGLDLKTLNDVAKGMVASGKGILAADESTPTIGKRFDLIGAESTKKTRNAYRDLLFTADGIENHISGVILFDETLRQSTINDGTPYPEHLTNLGIIPGIKVDKGAKPLAGFPDETVTEGLDGLRQRLEEYRSLGARFAKWRAVIKIGDAMPSFTSIGTNTHALARYAALCQESDIVPIVEPEILMDGNHTIEDSLEVTELVLESVFAELYSQGVGLEEMILKPNMVLSGYDSADQADVDTVAEMTLACLKRTVPAAVPGIAFLSGGQSDELATTHLNAMNLLAGSKNPWNLTFSYGRALQQPALKAWGGSDANIGAAQDALMKRAGLNGLASTGAYSKEME